LPATVSWARNTGKYRIQRDLLEIDAPLRVLDVGAVGPRALDLWRDLPLGEMPLEVVGVDADEQGIERARALGLPLELHAVSGYELVPAFGEDAFDLVVSTQVLEHVARPIDLLSQVAAVLRPGGRLWATLDSAHFSTSHAGDPLWKRVARPLAARLSESYFDFGLTEERLRAVVAEAGLRVDELLHCNLGPAKPMVAQLSPDDASAVVPLWYELERALCPVAEPGAFRNIYFAASSSR
jgi:2-polyprenyl-3-methyl-5-hydroxy-6-metoxy-1,4-benzoquinol methylase